MFAFAYIMGMLRGYSRGPFSWLIASALILIATLLVGNVLGIYSRYLRDRNAH